MPLEVILLDDVLLENYTGESDIYKVWSINKYWAEN